MKLVSRAKLFCEDLACETNEKTREAVVYLSSLSTFSKLRQPLQLQALDFLGRSKSGYLKRITISSLICSGRFEIEAEIFKKELARYCLNHI